MNTATFASADPNVAPKHDVPLWSETRWNGCWNPDQGVGLYLHAGRVRGALDLWWAQIAAYLPDGGLVVTRVFGENSSPAGVQTGGLDLQITDEGWTAHFDGICELTSTGALARAPRGASAPVARVSFDVSATSISPGWDPFAGIPTLDFAGDAHVQQASISAGALTVAGAEYSLDGVAFKDHSSGARSFETWHSHSFVLAHLPHGVLHGITLNSGEKTTTLGALFRDGEPVATVRTLGLPQLSDRIGSPETMALELEVADQPAATFEADLIHALPMTISEDNDNINGVDWELAGDPVVLVEGIGRFEVPGHGVGYGMLERSARRSLVTRPA